MSYGSNYFKKNRSYKPLYKSLVDRVGEEKAKNILGLAGEELGHIMENFPHVPKGERNHTDNYIFPRVALYRVLSHEFGEDAIEMIDEAVNVQGEKVGRILRKFTALPFMERLFLKIFAWMAKNMFGEENGFAQQFYSYEKGTVKFDILDCTYCRYCRQCDCPELIHTFCKSDAYCFGNLSKVSFIREQTLEYGEKCDFTLTIRKSMEG